MSFQGSVTNALKNGWLIITIAIILGGWGIWSYTQLNIDAYPDISEVQVQLITMYPGHAAEETEQQVTIPLERSLASIPHAEVTRSRTIFGLSVVQTQFEPGVTDYWAREQVFQAMSQATLPPNVTPSMSPLDTAYGEIFRYRLVCDKSDPVCTPMYLRELNDWVMQYRLLQAGGVAEVDNFGGLSKEYSVKLDPKKMLQYEVNLSDIENAIQANNSAGGGSMMERGANALVIRGLGQVEDYKDLANVFIKNSNGTQVFVRDIATIVKDHVLPSGIFSYNDDYNGVEGIVVMLRGANPSQTLDNVHDAIKELNESLLPKGVQAVPYYDRTNLIHETIHTVFHNTLSGIILVVLTLLLFMGSPRIAFVVALTIPGALLFALILIKLTGIPLSMLSIGAIDFGIIVDGAIIVADSIVHYLNRLPADAKRDEMIPLIAEACREIQLPMLFSMMMIIVAYLPLLSLQHIEGLLFRPMALTLCYTILGAILIAFYLVPVLASFLFKPGGFKYSTNVFYALTDRYDRLIRAILCHRKAVVGSTVIVFTLVMVFIVPRLGAEFLPYIDEGGFWLRGSLPEGISLKENAYYATQIRGIVREFDEVDHIISQSGRNDDGSDPFPTDRMEYDIILKPHSQWTHYHTKLELEKALRYRLEEEFPTVHFNLTQPIMDSVTEDTTGTSADLAIEIVGNDLIKLRALAEKTVRLLNQILGHVNVAIEQEGPTPQLQIKIDKAKLAHYQLSVNAVNDVINTAVGGSPISSLYEGERQFNIIAKYDDNAIDTPQKMAMLPVFNTQGQPVPLGAVTQIRIVDGQTLIARADGKRRVTVRADIRGRSQGDFVNEAKKLFDSQIQLPDGYSVEWMGMFDNLTRARAHFALLIPLTLAIIFGILYLTYGSLRMAVLTILTIPFAMIGGILALWLKGMHMNISTSVGFISLFGVATMYSVLMISGIRHLRQAKQISLDNAIIQGANMRLRPILMTAIVAILGLLPASMSTGLGSDVQRPIATVIVWGLFSAAFLSLLVLPAFYRMIEGKFGDKK